MKLLNLTVTEVEGVSAEYDFSAGNVRSPENAIKFLSYALFGNDALFSGKLTLTAETNGVTYRIERDLASAGAEVFENDVKIPSAQAETILSDIAGLKQSQWTENSRQANSADFVADPSSYLKKFLSELGFDAEELEKRWDLYYKDHSLFVSKVEAYDELVDDSYIDIVADKKARYEQLKEKFDAVTTVKQSAEEKGLIIALKNSLSEKLSALKEKEGEIAEKTAVLRKDSDLRDLADKLAFIEKSKQEEEELIAKLDLTASEIENVANEISSYEAKIAEKTAEGVAATERAEGLRDSFSDILYENLDDKELTNAVVKKTEGFVAATADGDKKQNLFDQLKQNHLSYKKRLAIREGVAFENSFDNSDFLIKELSGNIERNVELMERIKTEIAENSALIPEEAPVAADGATRLSLHEAKIAARALESGITENEGKIRDLLKTRKVLIEDVNALKKAKIAQEEYVRRCEKRLGLLKDNLVEAKSRIAFAETKEGLKIGDVCPVCNGRVLTPSKKEDSERTSSGYKNLIKDVTDGEAVLSESKEKLARIDTRLAALGERRDLTTSTINELSQDVFDKQKKLSDLLSLHGVSSVPDLERRFRALPSDGDDATIREHVAFLKARLDEIAAAVESDKEKLAAEQERFNAMKSAYDEQIEPVLDGKSALEQLDDIIASEKREDDIISEINGDVAVGNAVFSADNDGADIYVNLTAEIFADVMAEIKKSEDDKKSADAERKALEEKLAEKKKELSEKIADADSLKEQTSELKKARDAVLAEADLDLDDDERLEAIKKSILSDDERRALEEETAKYENDVKALDIQISALDGYNADDFDKEDYSELREETELAKKEYDKAATRLAVSEAAKDLAYEKTSVCELLTIKMDKLKKLADGEAFDVVLPVINDVLNGAESDIEARPDGNEIAFVDVKKGKKMPLSDVDADLMTTLVACAVNFAMQLVTGKDTTRFAVIYGKTDRLVSSAEKYGVVLL